MNLDKKHLAVVLPVGVFLWLMISHGEKEVVAPSKGKEEYYLQFNKDEIFKNLISAEEHFRNVELSGIDKEGFLQCNVKHLGSAESHMDEAVSHALVAENQESSQKFRELRNKTRRLRHKLQRGEVTPEEGIKETRKLRKEFEEFNPEFDVSKCEACSITVELEGLG